MLGGRDLRLAYNANQHFNHLSRHLVTTEGRSHRDCFELSIRLFSGGRESVVEIDAKARRTTCLQIEGLHSWPL